MGLNYSCNNCCLENEIGGSNGYNSSNRPFIDPSTPNNEDLPDQNYAKSIDKAIELAKVVQATYREQRIQGDWLLDNKKRRSRNSINSNHLRFRCFYIFSRLASYEGDWKAGKPHGLGRMIFDNGALYDGEFNQGEFHSQMALYIFRNGSYYKGGFSNGKAEGNGHFCNSQVDYVGQWLNNLPHGTGTQTLVTGQIYRGNFQFGKKHGHGSYLWPDCSQYTGDFINDEIMGRGCLKIDGCMYWGQFIRGKKNGRGKLSFSNGDYYDGEFCDDMKNGQGMLSFANGIHFIGTFKDELFEGSGKLTLPDGQIFQGRWLKGQLITTEQAERPTTSTLG